MTKFIDFHRHNDEHFGHTLLICCLYIIGDNQQASISLIFLKEIPLLNHHETTNIQKIYVDLIDNISDSSQRHLFFKVTEIFSSYFFISFFLSIHLLILHIHHFSLSLLNYNLIFK